MAINQIQNFVIGAAFLKRHAGHANNGRARVTLVPFQVAHRSPFVAALWATLYGFLAEAGHNSSGVGGQFASDDFLSKIRAVTLQTAKDVAGRSTSVRSDIITPM